MPKVALTIVMLGLSNVFMTFAWYAHLKELNHKPWIVAALASWGVALFEYLLQVPANRIGYQVLSLGQLKILQEVITLCVFVPFALFYMKTQCSQLSAAPTCATCFDTIPIGISLIYKVMAKS